MRDGGGLGRYIVLRRYGMLAPGAWEDKGTFA